VGEARLLADFLNDMYYGQWYHNAGVIVFAVVASHFVTLLVDPRCRFHVRLEPLFRDFAREIVPGVPPDPLD
jgi:hypothetical protein